MMWRLRTRRVVAGATLGAALFSGCGMVPCTEVGCLSGVEFELGDQVALFSPDEPVQVRACIDDLCKVDTLTVLSEREGPFVGTVSFHLDLDKRTLRYNTGQADVGAGPKTVSLELTREGNVVLDETREDVTFDRYQPNGTLCDPVCWSAVVSL